MRHIFFSVSFFLSISYANAQLWVEDFSGEGNGAQAGTAGGTVGGTWSVTADPGGTFNTQDGSFLVNNTDTEGTWSTNVINISSVGYAIIDVDIVTLGFGFGASDHLAFYYRLDGGPEVQFSYADADLFSASAENKVSAIVAGNTLQLIIKGSDNSFFGFILFDNVTITAAPIIYSRKSGVWTDAAAGTGTWSLTGHTGSACACYPLNSQVAIIGGGHTVTLPTSQTTIGTPPTTNLAPGAVDVYGTLQYNTNGVTLGIQQGLFRIRNGGIVNSSAGAITGEQISFQANVGGATFRVDAGGSATIEDLSLAAAATNYHYLTGSGNLTITDDILMGATDATLTNDRTASFSVGDDLDFNARSSFVNNGIITIGDDILVDANNSSFTNNSGVSFNVGDALNFNADNSTFSNYGTITITGDITANNTDDDGNQVINNSLASLSFANIDGLATGSGDGAFLTILNSGTINQSGTFLDIQNSTDASNDINNLNGGIWNYAGTGHDIHLRLFANNGINDFNYTRNGAQNIITPVTGDGYSNISLETSGAKTALANFNVYGDWSRSGTAAFTPAGFTVTLSGSRAQLVAATGGETFAGLTINNDFGVSPQITISNNITVTGVLTMLDGNVNLNGNTFTLTGTGAGALSHNLTAARGWMYGGSFARARPASMAISVDDAHSLFPLGSTWDWRPFFVGQNNIAATAGTMTVTHINSTSTSDVSIADTGPTATITKRHNSYWTPRTTASGGTYILRAGGTNFGTIANSGHLRMATSTGVTGTHSAGSGGPTDWRVNRINVSQANFNTNNFHVASTNATSSPLPIELLSFSAQLKNNEVELKWSTASETNNDYFTIERATNLEHFEPIIEEDGKGTSKELNHYKAIDFTPLYGRSYYRLKQTDFDGQYSYSSVQVINYEGPMYATLSATPNPLKGSPLTIRVEGLKETKLVPIQILNIHGQKVYERVFEVKTPGTLTEEIPAHLFTSSGLYIIKAGETLYLTKKIVVE